jgi:hypothetical protein
MIRTETGYRQTLKWIEEFEETMKNLKVELSHNPALLKIELAGLESQVTDLRKQARNYDERFLNFKKVA